MRAYRETGLLLQVSMQVDSNSIDVKNVFCHVCHVFTFLSASVSLDSMALYITYVGLRFRY